MSTTEHPYSDAEKKKILLELRYFYTESALCQKWALTKAQLRKWKTALNFKYLSGTFRELVIVALHNGAQDIPALIRYLDYLDHCIYSATEIEAALNTLRDEGIAQYDGVRWSYNLAYSKDDTASIF